MPQMPMGPGASPQYPWGNMGSQGNYMNDPTWTGATRSGQATGPMNQQPSGMGGMGAPQMGGMGQMGQSPMGSPSMGGSMIGQNAKPNAFIGGQGSTWGPGGPADFRPMGPQSGMQAGGGMPQMGGMSSMGGGMPQMSGMPSMGGGSILGMNSQPRTQQAMSSMGGMGGQPANGAMGGLQQQPAGFGATAGGFGGLVGANRFGGSGAPAASNPMLSQNAMGQSSPAGGGQQMQATPQPASQGATPQPAQGGGGSTLAQNAQPASGGSSGPSIYQQATNGTLAVGTADPSGGTALWSGNGWFNPASGKTNPNAFGQTAEQNGLPVGTKNPWGPGVWNGTNFA